MAARGIRKRMPKININRNNLLTAIGVLCFAAYFGLAMWAILSWFDLECSLFDKDVLCKTPSSETLSDNLKIRFLVSCFAIALTIFLIIFVVTKKK